MPREYNAHGRAGCVQLRRSKLTGKMVGIYHGVQSGIELDPEYPWVTLCEEHGTLCCHRTLSLARWHAPAVEWCEECQELLERGRAADLETSTFRVGG